MNARRQFHGQKVQIRHIDEVRGKGQIPDDWYRVPGLQGLEWVYYKNNTKHTVVTGSLLDSQMFEVWVGDFDGNTETISRHRKYPKAEEAALKFIRAHPQGW